MTKNNFKAILFASLIVAMVLPFSGMNYALAQEQTKNIETDAEKQDRLGNLIHDLESAGKVYDQIPGLTGKIMTAHVDLVQTLETEYYALSPQKELANISDERRAEITNVMWQLVETDYTFLSMGINSYTGELNIKLDRTNSTNIEDALQLLVGDEIELNITYGEDDVVLQGSCPDQGGVCTTIVGASAGEPNHTNDYDCTINIVATKGSGTSQVDGIVIPHHCNPGHNDYYQNDKNTSSQKVGPHHTDGGWYCDCDFVQIDTRASSLGVVNDAGSDISVTYGDLADNNAVYMIGAVSGKDFGTIVEVNQWLWVGGTLFTDTYYVKDINFTVGDSGAPIIRDSDEQYGGMNIAVGTETVDGNSITVNYVHDWTFLKDKLGLN